MKRAYVVIGTGIICFFAGVLLTGLCSGCKKASNTCHVCVYTRTVNDTTMICDDPGKPGYETNPAINHNIFVSDKYGYCIH